MSDAAKGSRVPRPAAAGVLATWVRLLVHTLVGVGTAPVLFRHVPADQLGAWYLLFALAAFVGLSDLGLPSTFARAVSFLEGRGAAAPGASPVAMPEAYLRATPAQLYLTALGATAALALLLSAVVLPAALAYFAWALPLTSLRDPVVLPLLLFLAGVVANAAAAIPGAGLAGAGLVAEDALVRTGAAILGFGLTWALVPWRGDLTALAAIYLTQGAAALAAGHLLLRRRRRLRRAGEPALVRAVVVALIGEARGYFTSRIGMWLTVESTLLVGAAALGAPVIADLGLLRQVAAAGGSLTVAIPIAVAPRLATAHAAGDAVLVRSVWLAAQRFGLVTGLLWVVGLLLWAPTALDVLAGPGHFLGYAVLVPVCVASLSELHGTVHGHLAWSLGRWPLAPWFVAGGALNLLLVSGGAAWWGVPGLAWGAAAARALTFDAAQAAYGVQRAGLRWRDYARDVLAPALAYGAVVLAAGLPLRWAFLRWLDGGVGEAPAARAAAALAALGPVAATAAAAGGAAWWLVLRPGDRAYLLALLGRGPAAPPAAGGRP